MRSISGLCGSLIASAVGVIAAGAPLPPQQPLPLSALPLQLVGVLVNDATPSKSACLIRCAYPGGEGETIRTGQRACELAEVEEIHQDFVIISNLLTHRPERLTLASAEPSAASPPPPPAPVVSASPDAVSVDLAKGSVDYYLGNLPDVLDSALATPRYQEKADGRRAIEGYEIGRIRPESVAAQVGLRNGDVVLEMNGQPLDGLPTVMRILGEIQKTPQVKVTVLRGGQRVTFLVNTR